MEERQLAQSVIYGRKITFLIFDGEPVEGYLAGLSDNYFYVLEPTNDVEIGFRRKIVNRACNPAFEMHDEITYPNEPNHAKMDEIIRPFRGWVSKNRMVNASDSARHERRAG